MRRHRRPRRWPTEEDFEDFIVLPPGFELASGKVLTYPVHSNCGCADCQAAVREHIARTLLRAIMEVR